MQQLPRSSVGGRLGRLARLAALLALLVAALAAPRGAAAGGCTTPSCQMPAGSVAVTVFADDGTGDASRDGFGGTARAGCSSPQCQRP